MTQSNPKPVEGARELVARLRTSYGAQGLLLEINAEMRELIGKFTGMDFSNPADIYLAMRHLEEFLNRQNNRHADALEAALSAAPAPTLRLDNSDFTEIMAGYDSGSVTRSTVMHRLNEWIRIHTVMANEAAAPARDGVRPPNGVECDWRTLLANVVRGVDPFQAGRDGDECCWCRWDRDRRIDSWRSSQKPEFHAENCEFSIAVAALAAKEQADGQR